MTKCIRNMEGIPDTHYFIYKNQKYPIKFDFFKHSSGYFSKNQEEIMKTKMIPLVDKDTEKIIDFTSESIECFIKYVQCKKIILDNTNVVALNYLSSKYEVTTLKEITKDFISEHYSDLALENLIIHQNDIQFDTSTYEEIIYEKLNEYIENDKMIKLNISILYRLLKKYQEKNILKKDERNHFIEFLFKILNKCGRSASILFSAIDFGDRRKDVVIRLMNQYSDEFEFEFISKEILNTLSETLSSIEEQRERFEKHNEQERKNMNLKIAKIEEELEKVKKNYEIELMKEKESHEIELKKQKEEILELNKDNEKMKKEILHLKSSVNPKEQENIISLPYNNQQQFDGIINYLTKLTGGNICDNGTINVEASSVWQNNYPKNLLNYNDNSFYESDDKNNAWILFDFKNKRIKVTNYSIKSQSDENYGFLKSWKVEVSNDGQTWTKIDNRNNCSDLNGKGKSKAFESRQSSYSRYVRLSQTEKPWGTQDYIRFHSIEFYGYLKDLA